MNLQQKVYINPKITTTVMTVFCILGIAHELLLVVTRLAMSFWMSDGIIFTIGNSYSYNIWSETVALFFRLFIFFAVLFVYSENKPIKRMTKGLAFVKVLSAALILFSIYWWLKFTANNPMDTWESVRETSKIIKMIYTTILITAQVVLFLTLIIKSENKVRTIFIIMFIASIIERTVFYTIDIIYLFTTIELDGLIFSIANVLYIICFVKAISITQTKYRELDEIDKKHHFLNIFYTTMDEV